MPDFYKTDSTKYLPIPKGDLAGDGLADGKENFCESFKFQIFNGYIKSKPVNFRNKHFSRFRRDFDRITDTVPQNPDNPV
jgi:hypothetical protein